MSGRSLIESLRRLAPVADVEAAAVFGTAGREDLLDGLQQLPIGRGARPRPVTRRRRLVVVLAAIAVVATATAATWAALRGAPARETTSVQCLINGSDAVIPSTSGDPVHDCAVDWRREYGSAPPALKAYDNGLGGVTVIPASQQPPKGWKPLLSQDVALIELQDSLDDYIDGLNASCLDAKAATALAKAKLAQFGFAGWTVSVRSGAGPCLAADVVDPAKKAVTLIPTSAPSGSPQTAFAKLAAKLRPLTKSCRSLPAAVTAVRAAADGLGLSESAKTYELDAVKDDSLRCASIRETVGGTIFLTVRGPGG
jgi:hypothetical protein